MSSLLRKRNIPGRPAPGRMWLGALAVVGLLSTVLSLVAAGQVGPTSTAALQTTAARAATAQHAAAPAAKAQTPVKKATTTSTSAQSSSALAGAMSTGTTKTVAIVNYAYSPASLTVDVGDTVTWTNMDTAPHTVTVASGPVKFASANLAKGESFSYTFTTAGTYSYYCAVHPDMVAKVVVNGSSTPPTPTPTDPAPTPTAPPMPMPSACGGLDAAVDAFMQHFYSAHLETSLTQQLTDALSLDQYIKTHTVLIANMLEPIVGGAQSAVDVFLQHVYAGHLETSPTQQVSDALAFDKYIKTHTVMIENMVRPLVGGDVTSC